MPAHCPLRSPLRLSALAASAHVLGIAASAPITKIKRSDANSDIARASSITAASGVSAASNCSGSSPGIAAASASRQRLRLYAS